MGRFIWLFCEMLFLPQKHPNVSMRKKDDTVHVRKVSKDTIYEFELVVGDTKVGGIRESAERNDSLGYSPLITPSYPIPPRRRVLEGGGGV